MGSSEAEEKKRRRLEAWRKKKELAGGNVDARPVAGPPASLGSRPAQSAAKPPAKPNVFGVDADDESKVPSKPLPKANAVEEEADPLDAFMEQLGASDAMELDDTKSNMNTNDENDDNGDKNDDNADAMARKKNGKRSRRQYDTSSSDDELFVAGDRDISDAAWAKRTLENAGGPKKLSKGEKIGQVDHEAMAYEPFRRAFYIEVPELRQMSDVAVRRYRATNGIKVRGKHVPKPLKTWIQAGLPTAIVNVLREKGFEAPLPIQSQALPVIMSGRDCMAVAKTGSGKTMSFVLPMLRHIKDQPPLAKGDGPIAIIMAPTRELVQQIAKEVKMVAQALGMRCTAVFGGLGIGSQIADLKRGSEVVVCTPGRMIDILSSGNKTVTNLSRVTYLVMDEADRMFDMGFEPQIARIISNIRPDRQTVLFSATFPRPVEKLAKEVLVDPVEIQMGGRSVVNSDITQIVEIRPESERFLRLLQLLGEWNDKGKILVFVSSQDRCDMLFTELVSSGYPCLSLHGGKDQEDRESTIVDFKSDACDLMVATSVAARGLDVKELVLVVNYDCPDHHEEYVHRVGRTGRAGRKGTAVTFIAPVNEESYAPDLIKALKESDSVVPRDLAAMSDEFLRKKEAGLVRGHASGFRGHGFKFTKAEEDKVMSDRRAAAGMDDIAPDKEALAAMAEAEVEDAVIVVPADVQRERSRARKEAAKKAAAAAAAAAVATEMAAKMANHHEDGEDGKPSQEAQEPLQQPQPEPPQVTQQVSKAALAAKAIADRLVKGDSRKPTSIQEAAMAAMKALGEKIEAPAEPAPKPPRKPDPTAVYRAELDINDFPQAARWEVTSKKVVARLEEEFGVRIKALGVHVKAGAPVPDGERRLYLEITASDTEKVRKAKAELRMLVTAATDKAMRGERSLV